MKDVIAKRKVCLFNHAVGLCNTGKTAEGEQYKYRKGKGRRADTDAAGNFKKTPEKSAEGVRQPVKGLQHKCQQIKKDHIAAQLCNSDKT